MTQSGHAGPDAHEIHDLLRQWHASMSAARDHAGPPWRDVGDLTFTQVKALSVLSQRERRVSDLARALGVSLASASSLSDRIVRAGLAERRSDPRDRRSVLLHLTPRARRVLQRLEQGSMERLGRVIERMTSQERVAFARTMRAFLRIAAERHAPRVERC